jgi:transcriptional regulator with XRE-family HTH domain
MNTSSGSELIKNARAHAGLTQGQLAQRIGTTQSAVSRWERGHDEPRLSSLSAILRACGLRLVLRAEVDDVDRSQVRQQLSMSPDERLASVVNLSHLLASARAVR